MTHRRNQISSPPSTTSSIKSSLRQILTQMILSVLTRLRRPSALTISIPQHQRKVLLASSSGSKRLNDGWIETSVPISLPGEGISHSSDATAPVFHVKGLLYRKPLEVLKAAYQEPSASTIPPRSLRRILETLTRIPS
jgi:hypothetical protein